jgi:hypothetical protein
MLTPLQTEETSMHNESLQKPEDPRQTPWNKRKLIGSKPPLRTKDVWSIRTKLQVEKRTRDLAMFNLAIDSKLRGCDVVSLKVEDVAPHGLCRTCRTRGAPSSPGRGSALGVENHNISVSAVSSRPSSATSVILSFWRQPSDICLTLHFLARFKRRHLNARRAVIDRLGARCVLLGDCLVMDGHAECEGPAPINSRRPDHAKTTE